MAKDELCNTVMTFTWEPASKYIYFRNLRGLRVRRKSADKGLTQTEVVGCTADTIEQVTTTTTANKKKEHILGHHMIRSHAVVTK
jgi:hypothetical protein